MLAWNARAFVTDPRTIWNAPIFFPYPETLAYSDHHLLLTVVALPLILLGGPVLAYNLLVLASYVLTGWAVYLLASDMLVRAHDRWIRTFSSFAAGALFAFGTYRMAHFVHLQLLQTAWLPLALLFLRRFLHDTETGKRRWQCAALFGIFTGIQCITALYYAYFTALTIGLYVVIWLLRTLVPSAKTQLLAKHWWAIVWWYTCRAYYDTGDATVHSCVRVSGHRPIATRT